MKGVCFTALCAQERTHLKALCDLLRDAPVAGFEVHDELPEGFLVVEGLDLRVADQADEGLLVAHAHCLPARRLLKDTAAG